MLYISYWDECDTLLLIKNKLALTLWVTIKPNYKYIFAFACCKMNMPNFKSQNNSTSKTVTLKLIVPSEVNYTLK